MPGFSQVTSTQPFNLGETWEKLGKNLGEEEFTLKVCTKCLVEQPLENYYKQTGTKDGLKYWCVDCVKLYRIEKKEAIAEQRRRYHKKYYAANRESLIAKVAEYYEANKEAVNSYKKTWAEKNKEELSAKRKAYYEANREEILAQQKIYYHANAKEILEKQRPYAKQWAADNRDKRNAGNHRRRVAMKEAEFDQEVTHESLRERDGDYCCYCGVEMFFGYVPRTEYMSNQVTLEHITPIDSGGSHTFDNAALCCWSCNSSKIDSVFLWEWTGRRNIR